MTEPTEEEVKAVAIALEMAGWSGRADDWRDFADMARAAILALDEHRAGCQVTTYPHEVAGVTKDGVKILKPIPRQSVSTEPPTHKDDF